jgi:hypothetical protein
MPKRRKAEPRLGVTRLLVSGTDDVRFRFHLAVCMLLNAIDRRRETVLYTCMREDRVGALKIGRQVGATVQEWVERTKRWRTAVRGVHPGWKRKGP